MARKIRRPVAALLSAGLLLGSVSAASAAPPQSFVVSWCFIQGAHPVATVTWSGYRVDAVIGSQNSPQHPLNIVVVDPPAREGTVSVAVIYDDAVPFAKAEIRLGKHVWRSDLFASTGVDFPNMPRC